MGEVWRLQKLRLAWKPDSPRYSRVMLVASIVVLNWKDEVATARCVASVRQLEGIEDCEIIVATTRALMLAGGARGCRPGPAAAAPRQPRLRWWDERRP